MKSWLITGASRGLGLALANAVLERGDNVVLGARDTASLETVIAAHPQNALVVPLDVTREDGIAHAVESARERFGSIDVLVNNAGYGYRAALEEGEPEAIRRQFDTNVWGPVNLMKAVLPGMRATRSGAIVNVSSISARRCPPGSGYYSASKAALESISNAVRKEVEPLGITVTIVEPGSFRTHFSSSSLDISPVIIDDYAPTAGARRRRFEGTQPGDPDKAAEVIIRAVADDNTPSFLLLGADALETFEAVAAEQAAVVDQWRAATLATAFD
ncbi:oxidoreductase [Microbacterium pygmaeum]|uniref:Short-chain dehydrogenase n=1 Tax=Microbacterium pygmaeum TaxID=370764 RepID=A0A1G7XJD3_9MICO|nr:oxidoreductase [Microbacterium pygmaeum]SDG84277.1 Short-chain dehydrogenase [Microbacterium pygmaeum]